MRITSLKIENFRSIKALMCSLEKLLYSLAPITPARPRFWMPSASRLRAAGVSAAQVSRNMTCTSRRRMTIQNHLPAW